MGRRDMKELIEKAHLEAKAMDRDKKIDSILTDEEYDPYSVEDTPSYKAWILFF